MSILATLMKGVQNAKRAALTINSQGPLNQLSLALHHYHDAYGCFPPAYVVDKKGVPAHSWRVLILPYAEQTSLYRAYDFNEPWNGPNNSRLAGQMPRIFCSPSEPESTHFTNIVAVTGPQTAFPGNSSTRLADFVDGAENTILLTEIHASTIPWLQPRDIDTQFATLTINGRDTVGVSSVYWRQPYVVFADSIHTYAVRNDTPPRLLRALTTPAGREPVTRSQLIDQGYLK
jgi:hypothetical protein